MVQFNYGRSAATASRLIKRFGRAATLRRSVNGAGHNPGAPTITNVTVQVVDSAYSAFERDGTLIKADDRRVLISTEGLNIVPTTTDKLVLDGVLMSIIAVDPLQPGGTPVLYTAQARR